VPFRAVLNGILYVLRTGCQWKAVPRCFGSGSTVHARFQQWCRLGVFEQLWALLLEHYDTQIGIAWGWQALDSATIKAPRGGSKTGKNPTDRGKSGSKRHVLVDQRGAPLAAEISGANTHDMKMTLQTVDNVVLEMTDKQRTDPKNICCDKGYDYPEIDRALQERGYTCHIRRRGEQPPSEKTHQAKRWVVERTHSWHNRFRKLSTRYELYDENYLGLVDFASALIIYRIIWRLLPHPKPNGVFG
jgi:putative transposase